MKKYIISAILLFSIALFSHAQTGTWSGKLDVQGTKISSELESRGYTIVGGGGRMPEEYLAPLSGKGTKESSFLDITADHPDYGRLRINTVDVLKDGVTPTKRELRNANRIKQQIGPNEHLLLIPKKK